MDEKIEKEVSPELQEFYTKVFDDIFHLCSNHLETAVKQSKDPDIVDAVMCALIDFACALGTTTARTQNWTKEKIDKMISEFCDRFKSNIEDNLKLFEKRLKD